MKGIRRCFISLCLAFVVVLFLFMIITNHCTAQEKVIKIGIPIPLTGGEAKFGEMMKHGFEIAREEINRSGGIRKGKFEGFLLQFVYEDELGKPEKARSATERLITREDVKIVMGGYSSSCSFAIAGVAQAYKTPFICIVGSADQITQRGWEWVFRIAQPASGYTSALRDFLDKVVKPQTMAIVHENTLFGTSCAKAMKKWCKEKGIQVVISETYEKGSMDFKPMLTKIKSKDPDVLFGVSYLMDAMLIARQIKELRLFPRKGVLAGGAAGYALPAFLEGAKDAAEHWLVGTLWSQDVPYKGARKFYDTFFKKVGYPPTYHAVQAHAGAYVVREAMENVESLKNEQIRIALQKVSIMTPFGPVKFENKDNYTNQNTTPTLVLQVLGGKHVTVWPPDFAQKKYVYPMPQWKEQ
ncbi:MAG: ABC transporter substrate-binding protein [Thermodesulfobacteriota bacterium]|nr:ABC transporter substrate-binding protein [Thermodesulfobacteriota bacterium]